MDDKQPKQMVLCDLCGVWVRADRLSKHRQKVHSPHQIANQGPEQIPVSVQSPPLYVSDENGVVYTYSEWMENQRMGEEHRRHPAAGGETIYSVAQGRQDYEKNKPGADTKSSVHVVKQQDVNGEELSRHIEVNHPQKMSHDAIKLNSKAMKPRNKRLPTCPICHEEVPLVDLDLHVSNCKNRK